MAFRYTFIGRPTTAYNLMTAIKNELVAAGWTFKGEFSDASGTKMYLENASYLMPDNTEAGKAVLEMFNPAGTNHVDIKMWERWDSTANAPAGLDCPTGTYRRLSYSYQSTVYYTIYANEYWGILLECDSAGSLIWNAFNNSIFGLLLPPDGIPTAPPYKAIFVGTPYDVNGNREPSGLRVLIQEGTYTDSNPFWLLPESGNVVRGSIYSSSIVFPTAYRGHSDFPAILYPVFPMEKTTFRSMGKLPYALITSNTGTGLGVTATIGNETWRSIVVGFNGGYGILWVRIS